MVTMQVARCENLEPHALYESIAIGTQDPIKFHTFNLASAEEVGR